MLPLLLRRWKGLATVRLTFAADSCKAARRLTVFRHTRHRVLHAGNSSMLDSSQRAVTSIASESLVGVLAGLLGS